MYTDTFSFEVENEGVMYWVDVTKQYTNKGVEYSMIISSALVESPLMDMYYDEYEDVLKFFYEEDGEYFLPLEQKISDKIISRNE